MRRPVRHEGANLATRDAADKFRRHLFRFTRRRHIGTTLFLRRHLSVHPSIWPLDNPSAVPKKSSMNLLPAANYIYHPKAN